MPMTTLERSRRANDIKTARAKHRRWLRALQEMRDDGIVVDVQAAAYVGPITLPDLTGRHAEDH